MNAYLEAYKNTEYKLVGHGNRDIQVLKEALESIQGKELSDIYGQGKIIEDFQNKMANYLGKESAVFFPSGTMAQQIALRIWSDEKRNKNVAYHPLCHLEIHEEDGLKELHQLRPILLADRDRLINLEDVTNINEEISCLLLELPQREIGGQLPEYETLESISSYCRVNGIRLHLDGARLFEILPYYQKSAEEVCALFDSVYISFYKGIGGIAGAILAGGKNFSDKSKVWKRRHGGDLISLYPYIVSANYYFDQRIHKMEQYYIEAKQLAHLYNGCNKVKTLPEIPVSNMFHVHFELSKEELETIFIEVYLESGIGFTGNIKETSDSTCSFEVSIGDCYEKVPSDRLVDAFRILNEKLKA